MGNRLGRVLVSPTQPLPALRWDNIDLRLVSSTSGATIRVSNHVSNEYEILAARQENGGTDAIQGVPMELHLEGPQRDA